MLMTQIKQKNTAEQKAPDKKQHRVNDSTSVKPYKLNLLPSDRNGIRSVNKEFDRDCSTRKLPGERGMV